ncbi:MAG: hypothetical protein M3Z04_23240 [Chloroflexota bacterium]|nr:hypothetical protein [Chloroflexota bacterium]
MVKVVSRTVGRAQELAQTTPQPWACWEFSPHEWNRFVDKYRSRPAGDTLFDLYILGVFIFLVTVVLWLGWSVLEQGGVRDSNPLRVATACLPLIMMLVMLPMGLYRSWQEHQQETASLRRQSRQVVITPLCAQWAGETMTLFDTNEYCLRVALVRKRTGLWIIFTRRSWTLRRAYGSLTHDVPVPPHHEAAAAALVARFQQEILNWTVFPSVATPPSRTHRHRKSGHSHSH